MMKRTSLALGLAVVVSLSAAMVGASAFTSATVERPQTIDVVADDAAPIALNDGGTGISRLTASGELEISVSKLSGVSGLNPNATYTFGNESAINVTAAGSAPGSANYVFSITNNGDTSHDVTIEYVDDDSNLGKNNVEITLLKPDNGSVGNKKTVFVGDSHSKTITFGTGETWYAVVTFDTGVGPTNTVTNSSNLDGTLNVTV